VKIFSIEEANAEKSRIKRYLPNVIVSSGTPAIFAKRKTPVVNTVAYAAA
jgi:hypothetical protein